MSICQMNLKDPSPTTQTKRYRWYSQVEQQENQKEFY